MSTSKADRARNLRYKQEESMNKTEFLDKIENLLNAVDKLPEGAEILSLFVDGCHLDLQVHNCIQRLEPDCRISARPGTEECFMERRTSLFGVSVLQLEPLGDAVDEDEADEDRPY